jgi:hypothetical protein
MVTLLIRAARATAVQLPRYRATGADEHARAVQGGRFTNDAHGRVEHELQFLRKVSDETSARFDRRQRGVHRVLQAHHALMRAAQQCSFANIRGVRPFSNSGYIYIVYSNLTMRPAKSALLSNRACLIRKFMIILILNSATQY